jgi:hypothetical protein
VKRVGSVFGQLLSSNSPPDQYQQQQQSVCLNTYTALASDSGNTWVARIPTHAFNQHLRTEWLARVAHTQHLLAAFSMFADPPPSSLDPDMDEVSAVEQQAAQAASQVGIVCRQTTHSSKYRVSQPNYSR